MNTAAKSMLDAVFTRPPHFVSKLLLRVSHLHLLSSKALSVGNKIMNCCSTQKYPSPQGLKDADTQGPPSPTRTTHTLQTLPTAASLPDEKQTHS